MRKNVTRQALLPADLKSKSSWVCWRAEERDGKKTKIPYNPNDPRKMARSNDPYTWADFERAIATAERGGFDGVGIVLVDDLVGVDLDVKGDTEREVTSWEIIAEAHRLGFYVETSPSGQGYRIFLRGALPRAGKGKNGNSWIEVYDRTSPRYLTVTGDQLGEPIEALPPEDGGFLTWLDQRFVTPPAPPQLPFSPSPSPSYIDARSLPIDDHSLLEKILSSSPEAARLWAGNGSEDHSADDLALCNILAWWCRSDAAQMDRIFRRSGLFRDKWDRRHYSDGRTYGDATIQKAISSCVGGYDPAYRSEKKTARMDKEESTSMRSEKKTTAIDEASSPQVNAGNRVFSFGRSCLLHTERKVDGETLPVVIPFAWDVWPVEKYEQAEDGEFGIRYAFKDHGGALRFGVLPFGAAVDGAQSSKASASAASRGVKVAPESKGMFAIALGHWGRTAEQHATLVRSSGWHRGGVYVNGARIFGGEGWRADEEAPAIEARSGRAGSAEAWRDLLTTKGLRAAVGLSLAGSLVGLLNVVPFGVHFCGSSSHGKSTVARLASAVWGNPARLFQTWNAGRRALEGLADPANGACLVLDEIKNFDGKADHLSTAIHSLCSQQGRARMAPDGTLLQQRRWENTLLSTGEVRTRDLLGQSYQGGHRVRLADAWIDAGDLTTDQAHAAQLDAVSYEAHGVLGDAWIEVVISQGAEAIRETWQRYCASVDAPQASNEQRRVNANLALVATALHVAIQGGLFSLPLDAAQDTLTWLVSATQDDFEAAGQGSANERAWALFLQLVDSQPHRFPFSTNHTTGRDVIAYKVVTSEPSEPLAFELWTTEPMLRASGIDTSAGVMMRRWLSWIEDTGRGGDLGRVYLEGMRRRWVRILPEDIHSDE